MKVEVSSKNPALESLFRDPKQMITMDANFLIPPDSSMHSLKQSLLSNSKLFGLYNLIISSSVKKKSSKHSP